MSQGPVARWHYRVLGGNRLDFGTVTVAPERKTAALLAYLGLEGAVSRSKLAGLLWPDSEEGTARNNLSQALRRFRALTGESLILGSDELRLTPELSVDAALLKNAALMGEAAQVATYEGDLLAPFDYDDLPEFGEWLYGTREALSSLQGEALGTLITTCEMQGDYAAALKYAERLLHNDPVSEVAHRHAMRLHYLQGDRAAALIAYRRCRDILKRDLGVEPLPETIRLAQLIEQGAVKEAATPGKATLPPQVLRPPVLVGREAEWAQLEAAWARGQTIYVTGEPGVGKTRLVQEFVASKGRALYLGAQPGYQDVLFAAAAGLARTRIAGASEVALPEWVERELSRILPEYRTHDPLPPLRSEEDKLRFFQAYFEMSRLKGQDYVATVSDDTQYYDLATVELGGFMIAQGAVMPTQPGAALPRYIIIYRRGELSPAAQARIDAFVASDVAARIDLEPLGAQDTTSLLVSLELSPLDDGVTPAFAEAIFQRTGGNVLFILETLRDLLETDRLSGSALEGVPLSRRVSATVAQRLARFSLAAQRVVQAAAVLQRDFDVELVAQVLGSEPLALLETWEELERAQIFRGNAFSHDLLYEAASAALSPQVAALLHRRCAEVLVERGAPSVRIANHYLASGDEGRAAPYLLEAATRAKDTLRLAEAAERFERVGAILERQDDRAAAFDAYRQALELRLESDLGDAEQDAQLFRLRRSAKTPLMRAMVWRLASQRQLRRGDYAQAEAAARAGLEELELLDDKRARTDLLAFQALALARLGRSEASAEVAATLQTLLSVTPEDDEGQGGKWSSVQLSQVAAVLDELGHRSQALALYRRALALPSGSRDRLVQLAEYGYSLLTFGDAARALGILREASEQLADVADAAVIKTRVLTSLGTAYYHLGQIGEALDVYETSLAISEPHGHAVQSEGTRVRRARLYLYLGALEEAEKDILEAQRSAAPRHIHQIYLEVLLARLATQRGQPHTDAFARIEAKLTGADARLRVFVRLEQLLALPTFAARSAFAEEIFDLTRDFALPTVEIAAHTFYAQRLLALGQVAEARDYSQAASRLLDQHTSVYLDPLEVLLTHYRVLEALEEEQAGALLERAVTVLHELSSRIPERYRQSFLFVNPVHAQILRAAAGVHDFSER